jgi:hypothetical protein
MKTDSRSARGVNRPRGETITQVLARERELSTRLNRLIGEANCEAALLPTRRTISEWTSEEVHEAVVRCQYAAIAVLQCAIELQALDDLDAYSKLWILEALEKCEEHLQSLELIQNAYCSSALEDG